MKKSFVIISFLGVVCPALAAAQYYNYGGNYPASYVRQPARVAPSRGYSNTNYYAPAQMPQKKQREIGSISVGADYVLGYASYKTVDFVVDSALAGGQDYVSDTRDFDRSFNSVSFNIGWRPLRYFGVEAFYSTSFDEDKVKYTDVLASTTEFNRGEYSVSYKVYGLDLLGYVPVNDYIEFIASVGVGKYDAEAKVKVTAYDSISYGAIGSNEKTFEDSAWAYRIGAGGQIWLSKHLTFRAMVHWAKLGGDFMDYITEINAGVRYHF